MIFRTIPNLLHFIILPRRHCLTIPLSLDPIMLVTITLTTTTTAICSMFLRLTLPQTIRMSSRNSPLCTPVPLHRPPNPIILGTTLTMATPSPTPPCINTISRNRPPRCHRILWVCLDPSWENPFRNLSRPLNKCRHPPTHTHITTPTPTNPRWTSSSPSWLPIPFPRKTRHMSFLL